MEGEVSNAWAQKAHDISLNRRGVVGTPEKDVFAREVNRVQKNAGATTNTFGDLIAFRDDYRQAIGNIACRDGVFRCVQAQILSDAIDEVLIDRGLAKRQL